MTYPNFSPLNFSKMNGQTFSEMQVFATGVYLVPMIIVNEQTGQEQFIWVAESFEEGTFQNGVEIDPQTDSATLEGLIKPFNEE